MYWLPKLHKMFFKQRLISESSQRTTNKMTDILTSRLTNKNKFIINQNNNSFFLTIFSSSLVQVIFVGIPIDINCVPSFADFYCYESQLFNKLHKDPSKSDLIDQFKNSFNYPEESLQLITQNFSKYVTAFYHREITLNKANKASNIYSFLDLNVLIFRSYYYFRGSFTTGRGLTVKPQFFYYLLLVFYIVILVF